MQILFKHYKKMVIFDFQNIKHGFFSFSIVEMHKNEIMNNKFGYE